MIVQSGGGLAGRKSPIMVCGSPLWKGKGGHALTNEAVDMGVMALSEMGTIIPLHRC
jgi:hypothetical protein